MVLKGVSRYAPCPVFPSLGDEFFDVVEPARFPKHVLRFRNQSWAERVGLGGLDAPAWERHFAAFAPLEENLASPLALRYHGHQFGVYNAALGDGRGFLFAQLRDDAGRLLDLGTKGSGQTPWSRGGDGRLTLKGGVREVLATEMLEALGVPTSRSFSLFETGEAHARGDEPSPTRSSVLVRLSHSHIRFGTFQRLAHAKDATPCESDCRSLATLHRMPSIKIILVATDFTEISDHATDYAIDLARQLGARVTLLHSYEIPVYGFPDGTLIATADVATKISVVAQTAMDAVVEKHKASGVPVTGMVTDGAPVDEVHRVAEELNADLIVVGTHGRRGLARALLGSIAEAVIRISTRPVLAIHAAHAK